MDARAVRTSPPEYPEAPRGAQPRRRRGRGGDRWRTLRVAAVLGSCLVLGVISQTVLAAAPSAAPSAGPSGTPSALQATGARLFEGNCSGCHGTYGEGRPGAPNLRPVGAALVDFVLRTGRMPLPQLGVQMRRGDPKFDEAATQALVAYVGGFDDGPAIPQVNTAGADLARGRELFVSNCAACHGPGGDGGAVGGGFIAPTLNQADATTVGEAVIGGPIPMPRFGFSSGDLDSLAAYVLYLRSAPTPGGIDLPLAGPVSEGFVAGAALVVLLLVARLVGGGRREDNHAA